MSTTIEKKQYTLSDINDLANKILKKVSAEMRLLIFTMILQKKVKQLQNQDKCKSRQKYLDIINSLKNFFDEQPDTNITDLETEESAPERRNQH